MALITWAGLCHACTQSTITIAYTSASTFPYFKPQEQFYFHALEGKFLYCISKHLECIATY